MIQHAFDERVPPDLVLRVDAGDSVRIFLNQTTFMQAVLVADVLLLLLLLFPGFLLVLLLWMWISHIHIDVEDVEGAIPHASKKHFYVAHQAVLAHTPHGGLKNCFFVRDGRTDRTDHAVDHTVEHVGPTIRRVSPSRLECCRPCPAAAGYYSMSPTPPHLPTTAGTLRMG